MNKLEAIKPKSIVTIEIDGDVKRVNVLEAHKLVSSGKAEYRPKSVLKVSNQGSVKKDTVDEEPSIHQKTKLKAKDIRKLSKKNK